MCCADGAIDLHATTGQKLHALAPGIGKDVSTEHFAVFSPDGSTLCTVMNAACTEIRVWDAQKGKQRGALPLTPRAAGGHALGIVLFARVWNAAPSASISPPELPKPKPH